jgi:sirohydrochlorin ferrochelatase
MLVGWAVLFTAAIAAGVALCASLVASRRSAYLFALGAVAAIAVSMAGVSMVGRDSGRIDSTFAAAFIGLGGLLGGYALASSFVPSLTRLPPLPSAASALPATSVSDLPHVIVVAEGQPEHYDPKVTTQAFQRLADSDVPMPPDVARTFAYLSDRSRYRAAGLSPSRPVARALTRGVVEALAGVGFSGPVHEAWLQGCPRLCDAISDAVADGASRIAVVLLDVAESYEFDLAVKETDTVGATRAGARVEYAPPLWADDRLARMVHDRIIAELRPTPRSSDGALLVASGQPWQWDRTHPQESEHETFFCQRVRAMLIESGLEATRVRVAWLDWQEPDVTEAVRHLAAIGCGRVVVAPATAPADSLAVALDLPVAVEQAAAEETTVTVLHGWGDDPVVVEVLADRALAALADLGWTPEDPAVLQ